LARLCTAPHIAPLPPVHPDQPERHRLPQDYRCRHHLPPHLVSAALKALSAKWPCPSPSSLLPRAPGSHHCRLRSPERLFIVKTPLRQTASPPHHRRPSLVSPADHRLARCHPVPPLVPVGHTWSPTRCHNVTDERTTATPRARPRHGDRTVSHQHAGHFPSWAGPSAEGCGPQCGPALCARVLIFHFLL
jgi:hypothetical protein